MVDKQERLMGLKVFGAILLILLLPNISLILETSQKYGGRKMLIRDYCDSNPNAVFKSKTKRDLSIVYPDGSCKYTGGVPYPTIPSDGGILITSFPASGMRLTWQHLEGLTAIVANDDYDCHAVSANRNGLTKTQYPHLEGIWSWGDAMTTVILLVRNPRWAIPVYHNILYEIDYAHDCESAYELKGNLFKSPPHMDNWTRWRDFRFDEEVILWGLHIDYWMGNGTQYWEKLDFERNGQYPFNWVPEENRTQDLNCKYQKVNCYPKVVVAFELIDDPVTGPDEVNKMATVIEDMVGFDVIDREARECIFNATLANKLVPHTAVDDYPGMYEFTYAQMKILREAVQRMKDKYSSEAWTNIPHAQSLVAYFDLYIDEIQGEITQMEETRQFPPTPSPNPDYHRELKEWYISIGRGDRYAVEKLQKMAGLWPLVSHYFPNETLQSEH